jgi:hypothetical protein
MRLERHIPKQSYNKEQKTAGFNKGKTWGYNSGVVQSAGKRLSTAWCVSFHVVQEEWIVT